MIKPVQDTVHRQDRGNTLVNIRVPPKTGYKESVVYELLLLLGGIAQGVPSTYTTTDLLCLLLCVPRLSSNHY
jgi:hypothetical protein